MAFNDDDDDLSNVDRGDTLTDEQAAAPDDDEAEEKPAEEKPADEKPAEEKPAEEKPAEEKPADEKPAAEKSDDDEDLRKQNYPHRLNKALQQRDAERQARQELEARLKALEEKAPKPEPEADPVKALNDELEELYVKVEEARADGDTKAAATMQRRIDAVNRDIAKVEAIRETRQVTSAEQHNAVYNRMADHIEQVYDVLNPNHDDYNPAVAKELEFEIGAYEKAGLAPPAAMRRAVRLLFGEDPFAEGFTRKPPEPEKKPETPPPPPKPADKKPNIEKAIETEKRQPPAASDRGLNQDGSKVNIAELSDDEYDRLPESVKKKYRGDFDV